MAKTEENLHIIRSTPERIAMATQGVYYYVEDNTYIVHDLRGKSPQVLHFDSIDAVIAGIK